jgi:heat shock protein HslJ
MVALLMAGCGVQRDTGDGAPAGGDSAPPEAPITPATLPGTEWTVVELRGAPPLPLPPLRLRFDTASVGGFGGCNWFGTRYEIKGDTIRTFEVQSTLIGCDDPVGRQELALHAAIKEAQRVLVAGDTLRMRNAADAVVIVAVRRRLVAMEPAQLRGRWRLVEKVGMPHRVGPDGHMAFSGDSVRGFAGCRDFVGTYYARGHRLGFTSISMNATECAQADRLRFEGVFTTDLSSTTDYQIAGDTLTLHTSSGRRVRFVREP